MNKKKLIGQITRLWPEHTTELKPTSENSSPPVPPEDLVKAIDARKLVLLVGAGISRQATANDGKTKLPTWSELIERLIKETNDKACVGYPESKQIQDLLKRGKYLMVSEVLRERLERFGKNYYIDFLRDTFEIELTPAPIHESLRKLKLPLILTTNYDQLLEKTYSVLTPRTQDDAYLVQKDLQDWNEEKPPVIFKIHGSISKPESIVLTERDYRQLVYNKSGYRTILTAILVTHTVLILGFSFEDPELTELFGFMRDAFEYKSRNHYILIPSDNAADLEQEYNSKNYGVRTIPYNSSDDHRNVLLFIDKLIEKTDHPQTSRHHIVTNHTESNLVGNVVKLS